MMYENLPLISIIIPVYKVAEYFDECVKSVISQTYQNLEIILVDDGSPDECPEMCDKWAQCDNRIIVIHKENGGASSARNVGLDIAQGEYIGFVDSDDYLDQDMFTQMYKAIQESGLKMSCCSSYRFCDSDKNVFADTTNQYEVEYLDVEKAVESIFSFEIGTAFWSRLLHNSVLEGIRFPEGEINEEYPLLIPVTVKAGGTAFVKNKLYYYRDRVDSVTGNLHKSIKTLQCVKKNLEIMNKQLSEYGLKSVNQFPLFVSQNSYNILLSIIKNHNKIEGELKELYKSYLELIKENKKAFLSSKRIKIKDKIIYVLLLSKVYKKLLWIKRKLR